MILGVGPIGLVSLMVAKSFGAAVAVVTDVSDERLKVASEVCMYICECVRVYLLNCT